MSAAATTRRGLLALAAGAATAPMLAAQPRHPFKLTMDADSAAAMRAWAMTESYHVREYARLQGQLEARARPLGARGSSTNRS